MEYRFDNDFIAFTYNGKHSIRDLNLYRVSDGSRYQENLLIDKNNKIYTNNAIEGAVFQNSFDALTQIPVNIAFDNLIVDPTENRDDIKNIKDTFGDGDIHELIFDERPYRVYDATVSGAISLSFICFEEKRNGHLVDVFKGDTNINFQCPDPYAHSAINDPKIQAVAANTEEIPVGLYLPRGSYTLKLNDTAVAFSGILDDKTQIYTNSSKQYNVTTDEILLLDITLYIIPKDDKLELFKDGELFAFYDGFGLVGLDGRTCNGYSYGKYPTKFEWTKSSGLPHWKVDESGVELNNGELPTPIKVTANSFSGLIRFGDKKLRGNKNLWVKIDGAVEDFCWDSATGLVTSKGKPIKYEGNSYGKIDPGDSMKPTEAPSNPVKIDYVYKYY